VNFLLDQNMPVSLCGWLAARGHSAEHIRYIAMRDAPDQDICLEAKRRQAIIVTKDKDYVALVEKEQILQLLLIRTGNKTTAELFHVLDAGWADVEARLLRGQGQVEIG
jgi:predicted nuclease of predicted toxin-antitoxin system